ncbi:MAG: DUF2723 domain-containing protein, partial [Fulvivirga sp.]|nr:DUF2723 domain-containing protein [Fulvivirga sp.]
AMVSTVLCLSAPAIMAQQGWDDHDRSNRFFSVDSAKNFLASCDKNAVLFTGGDNDTFPLWYSQDVEGFRTDMRVVVLSYYNTDWYIEQTMRQVNNSEPFPYTLTLENYRQGGPNDYLPYEDMGINRLNLKQYLNLLKSGDKRLRIYQGQANALPSRTFMLEVDKEKVLNLGIIPEGMDSLVVDRMVFSLKRGKNALEKKDLALLDLLATADWERPLYLNNTSMQQINVDLSKYAIQEGNAYRILPIENPDPQRDFVNTAEMYDNLINNFYYRELDNPNTYYNEDYRNFVLNHRTSFNTLAAALINEGQLGKAKDALIFSLEKMPDESIPYDYTTTRTVALLYRVGESDRGYAIAETLGNRAIEMAEYLISQNKGVGYELQKNLVILSEMNRTLLRNGEEELAARYKEAYDRLMGTLEMNRQNF